MTTTTSVRPSWVDMQNHPHLAGFQIEFASPFSGDAPMEPKIWLRDEISVSHWERLLEIAETAMPESAEERERTQYLGFTWVSRVWLNQSPETQGIALDVPDHIRELAELAGLSI